MPRPDPSLAPREGAVVLRAALVRGGRIVSERRARSGVLAVVMHGGEAALTPEREGAVVVLDASSRALVGRAKGRIVGEGRAAEAIDGPRSLAVGDRGRVDLPAGWALLFELAEDVPRAAPRLPLALRRAPLVDGPFTAIAMGSFVLHAAFVLVLEHMDPPYVHALVPTRTAELLMEIPETPIAPIEPPVPSTEGPSDPPSTEGRDEGETEVASARRSPGRGPVRPAEAPDLARIGSEIDRLIGASAIGSLGLEGSAGPSAGAVLSTAEGTPTLDPSPTTLATRSGGGTVSTEGFGTLHGVAGGSGLRSEGPALEATGPVGGVEMPGCGPDAMDCDEPSIGSLDSRVVIRAVRGLSRALTRCYEHQLTSRSPDLRGSVDVAFDIEESGEVSRVRAAENTTGSTELAQCAVAAFRRLPRFHPGPVGGSVSFRFPIVFEPAD